MLRKQLYLFCLLSILCSYSIGQDARMEYLEGLAQKFTDSLHFNGVIMVAEGDEILLQYKAGFANHEHQVAHQLDSKFRIASISKVLTSFAIYRLQSLGRLELEDPIGKYLPTLKADFGQKIKIKDLVLHQAGLIRDYHLLSEKSNTEKISLEEMISLLNETNLMFEPGASSAYSNVGYSLLAMIIAKIQQKPYEAAMKELVFEPLDMFHTGHEMSGVVIANKASGYDQILDQLLHARSEDKSWVIGSGSIFSTAPDLLKFARAVSTGSLLSKDVHSAYIKDLGNFRTGGSWVTWNYTAELPGDPKKGQILMHAGSSPGFRSVMILGLEHEIAVVALSNHQPLNVNILYNKLMNVALGYVPEEVHQEHLERLLPNIFQGDLKQAQQAYEKLLIQYPNGEKIKAANLNSLGYILKDHSQLEKAIQVFRFGILLFPENANLFDSLGEVLISGNQIKEGLRMYQKSLELNPKNEGARQMIKKYTNKN